MFTLVAGGVERRAGPIGQPDIVFVAITDSPVLTAEQRQTALARAREVRIARATLLGGLKEGTTTLAQLLDKAQAGDEMVKKTKVLAVVKVMPGIGDAKARQLLEQADIAENRRVGGLGHRQRAALLAATG